ncbi:MAG: DUF882 domain-containing protein [Myxococcales bacterium]|nr:DUF882 domain-containing protein [Myxococcales bacterium]
MHARSARSRTLAAAALAALFATSGASGQPRALPPLAFAPPDGSPRPRSESAPSKKALATTARPTLLPPTITVASIHLRELIAWDGACDPNSAGPRRIDWILRDRTNWQSASMDDRTLRAVHATCEQFSAARIEVISGYRSSKMNEMLRKKGRHVAQRSQHPMATAVDFRLVDVAMEPVFRALERGHNGGVGRYRDDAFVHVDSGPRRRWRGE